MPSTLLLLEVVAVVLDQEVAGVVPEVIKHQRQQFHFQLQRDKHTE